MPDKYPVGLKGVPSGSSEVVESFGSELIRLSGPQTTAFGLHGQAESSVKAIKASKRRSASLKLLRPRENVRLLLETLHLLDTIPVAEDEAQAIASFR